MFMGKQQWTRIEKSIFPKGFIAKSSVYEDQFYSSAIWRLARFKLS